MRRYWKLIGMTLVFMLLLTPAAFGIADGNQAPTTDVNQAMDQLQNERGSVDVPGTINPVSPSETLPSSNPQVDKEVSQPSAVLFSSDKTEVSRGLNPAASLIKALINKALQFQGIRYRYSGTTPKGFDCSGFVYYVFKQFGIDLPHSSRDQAGLGVHVDKSSLAEGDLVFFKTGGSSRISHVGIYIGNNRFVHASTNKGITVTSLDEAYYLRSYCGARRIIGE